MRYFNLVWLFFVGSAIGSFLNVCIYRLPKKKSLFFPRSACPSCNTPIKFYHNIPIFSYLFLRGKCAYCGFSIPATYFVVELISALAPVFFVWFYNDPTYALIVTILFYGLLTLSIIDWEIYIIPNSILLTLFIAGILVNFWSPFILWTDSAIGFLVGGGTLYLLALIGKGLFKKESMGMGDVKLAAVLGFFMGWKSVLPALYFGFLLAALYYMIIKFFKKKPIDNYIPMGPFFSLSAMIWLLWGKYIIAWYFDLLQ